MGLMQKLQNTLFWTIVASETSHVFCCVLPTVVSLASLLSGLGLVSALPAGVLSFHDFMHRWEIPLIIFSGVVLALGWALHIISVRIDCHDSGCGHEPCAPKKRRTTGILKIATALFAVNTSVYFAFHAHGFGGGH